MGFDKKDVAELLVKCHRRCCVCHRFCGSKMEIDHITQKAEGGSDDIENGIAVCFDCHAEIHHYNNNHPKGRKFTAEEIKGHKHQWLEICKNKPEIFSQPLSADVGCIGGLIDELEFNLHSVTNIYGSFFCPLRDKQFKRAIKAGIISILDDTVRNSLLKAYDQIGKVNNAIQVFSANNLSERGMLIELIREQNKESIEPIRKANNDLQKYVELKD
jgi:HNH endonuclease